MRFFHPSGGGHLFYVPVWIWGLFWSSLGAYYLPTLAPDRSLKRTPRPIPRFTAMLNWVDLSLLLMMLAGPCSGVVAAHHHKAGVLPLILAGFVGLAIGSGVGMVSSKFAYRVLDSKTFPAGLQIVAYILIPLFSLLLVVLAPAWLAAMIYGRA